MSYFVIDFYRKKSSVLYTSSQQSILAPCDFWLFSELKKDLGNKQFPVTQACVNVEEGKL